MRKSIGLKGSSLKEAAMRRCSFREDLFAGKCRQRGLIWGL